VESFIEFGTPVVALGFGGEFPLLIRQVRPNQVHFDEWTEHTAGYYPLQVVRGYH
jgi:hypothetical protein